MSKLVFSFFLLVMVPLFATVAISSEEQSTKKSKYADFQFSPTFGEKPYAPAFNLVDELSVSTSTWLKSQIGEMEPSNFSAFGLVGSLSLEGQGDFARMGLLTIGEEMLNELNIERSKLGLSKIEKERPGSRVYGKYGVFGVFKEGKETLKLERKNLQIEKDWGETNYLMSSPMPLLDYLMDVPNPNVHDAHDRCSIKSYLFANDLNLDAHPELFSFEGWRLGYMPEYGMIGAVEYITLHVNDGQTGKEVFAVKLAERNPFGLDPETQESKAPHYQNQAKLYFADFDENDRLDILVWQRNYNSNNPLGPDVALRNPADWKLESESFKRFEESPDGYKETPVTTEQAKKWMKERNLTWRKGFPDKNACSTDAKTEPFAFFSDPVLHE